MNDDPIILASPEERGKERDNDINYKDDILTEWVRDGERASITVEEGWSSSPRWPSNAPDANVGDRIRVWTQGLGSGVNGVSLWQGDKLIPIWYSTKQEREAEHGAWVASWQKKQRQEFKRNKKKLDTLYNALPFPLQRRIDRFRMEDPDFRWREESYEMAACAEAGRLYRWALDPETGKKLKAAKIISVRDEAKSKNSYEIKVEDGILNWEDTPENRLIAIDSINSILNKYNYKLLEELFPEVDKGHSGNTWGHAMMFALLLVRDGDNAQL